MSKYYYVIINKNTRKMLIQDSKLPIYWNKKVAVENCRSFKMFTVVKVSRSKLEWIII